MNIESLTSNVSRLLFLVAVLFSGLAVAEKVANLNGQTLSFMEYEAGRLLEFAAIMLLFVVTLTLRRILKVLMEEDA